MRVAKSAGLGLALVSVERRRLGPLPYPYPYREQCHHRFAGGSRMIPDLTVKD